MSGVATFSGCAVDKIGTYTLTATATSLTSALSTAFTITAGAPAGLIITNATNNAGAITPACTGSGSTWTCNALGGTLGATGRFFTATVTLVDAGGNATVNTGSAITVAVSTSTLLTTVSGSPVTIAGGAANSTTQFTLNLAAAALVTSQANYTATATVSGSTATLTGTVS